MSFTETTYFNRLRHFVTIQGINTSISRGSCSKISLEQFKTIDPELPLATETAINCLVAAAKGAYHLFYAIVVGLPSDWLTLKTHVFLLNWDAAKSKAEDVYFHALAWKNPVLSAFRVQEKLYLQECRSVKPKDLTETIPLPPLKNTTRSKFRRGPTSTPNMTTGTISPNTSSKVREMQERILASKSIHTPTKPSHMPTKPIVRPKISIKPPEKKPEPPPKTTTGREDSESMADLRKRMHAKLLANGLGTMGTIPMGGTKPKPPPPSSSDKPAASAKDKPAPTKVGKIDTSKFGNIAEMLGNRGK
ncbi:hypothetical protein [Simkania sp.]|uniref:hypothetical protein n=1 Tax=Simkania sp. TaxID=34094 RepID=UPI003B517B76